jgi:REP element-mobilizing transposase RayT
MPQSLVQVYVHLIWSTKHRTPFLKDHALRTEMHHYLGGTCNKMECPVLQVGGVEDHVHILCRLGKSRTVPELLAELKRESSKWVKQLSPALSDFYWQDGYGAFSVSPSHVDPLIRYITNQEQHHRNESFQDEFRRLCKYYWVELD